MSTKITAYTPGWRTAGTELSAKLFSRRDGLAIGTVLRKASKKNTAPALLNTPAGTFTRRDCFPQGNTPALQSAANRTSEAEKSILNNVWY